MIEVYAKDDLSFTIPVEKSLEGFILVGLGEPGKLNDKLRCGDIDPFLICTKDYKVHGRVFRCKLKTCPNCHGKWLKATVTRLTEDLWLLKNELQNVIWVYDGKKFYGFRIVHITLSISEEDIKEFRDPITGEFNKELFIREGLEYLKSKLGIDEIIDAKLLPSWNPFHQEFLITYRNSNQIFAGVLIFHPYRPNELYYIVRREERGEEDENPAKELKKWEWIKSQPDWKMFVRFSPHLHYVGLVPWLKPPKKGEKWIYKFIAEIKTKDDLFAVLYYLLTHTGVRKPHERVYSRVGLLAPGKFNRKWIFKDVKRYFKKSHFLENEYLQKMKFKELKKLIEEDNELKKSEKEALITKLKMYRYHCKRAKRTAYRCKLCGSYLTGLAEGLRAYFRSFRSISALSPRIDPLKVYPVEVLKKLVRKDDMLSFEAKKNLLEALDIYMGWKPPPESIPVV